MSLSEEVFEREEIKKRSAEEHLNSRDTPTFIKETDSQQQHMSRPCSGNYRQVVQLATPIMLNQSSYPLKKGRQTMTTLQFFLRKVKTWSEYYNDGSFSGIRL